MSATPDNVVAFLNGSDPSTPVLIPEGEYHLTYRRHGIVRRFNRDVLEVWFDVADYGEHFGKRLARYYSIRASDKRRSFTARPGSDFVREYAQVFAQRPRFGAAPMEPFTRCFLVGCVETVKTDHRQEELPKVLHYSTIRRLLRREGG